MFSLGVNLQRPFCSAFVSPVTTHRGEKRSKSSCASRYRQLGKFVLQGGKSPIRDT